MNPVPYTRAAVQRIREGATAAELGWSGTMFERVRREHGIDIMPIVKAAPIVPEAEIPSARVVAADEGAVLRFDRKTGDIFYHGVVIPLKPVQAKVFEAFFDLHASGDEAFHTAEDINKRMGSTSEAHAAMQSIRALNHKLQRIGVRIESKQGNCGGFRLRVGAFPAFREDAERHSAFHIHQREGET